MSTSDYIIVVSFPLGTILIVFAMKYLAAAAAARARVADDNAYRTLAEKALATQAELQASLAAIRTQLAAVATSQAAVETILKQV